MPLVSIIMNCYNCSQYLSEALDSVSQQTFKDYEIICWDNQSTDGSREIALGYGEPLRYFRGEEFLPLGAARNAALEKAQGKYIAFLDCDDIWFPEKLKKQIEIMESNEELGLVFSDSYVIDSKGNLLRKTYFRIPKPSSGRVFNELFTYNFIPILTVVIRSDVLGKVGIFDSRYLIAEDYDLFLRIAEHYPIGLIKEPLTKYRIHKHSVSQRNMIRSFIEELQIKEDWLRRKPTLKKEIGSRLRRRKALLYLGMLILSGKDILINKNRQSLREMANIIKLIFTAKL